MARASECLDANKLLPAQIDFWLIPEFDPVLLQSLVEIYASGKRRGIAEVQVLQDFQDGAGLEWLFEHRQHLQEVVFADAFDVGQHGRATAAHQLDVAAIAASAERGNALDGLNRLQSDVQEDKIWHPLVQRRLHITAVGKSVGIDASTMQDEREELPDARIGVDHKAERGVNQVAGCGGLRQCRRRFGR